MTEWTPEKLSERPEHTVIQYKRGGLTLTANRRYGDDFEWIDDDGIWMFSEDVLSWADPGTIRVVAIPVDALLSDEVAKVVADALGHTYRTASRMALRVAISHIAGEES